MQRFCLYWAIFLGSFLLFQCQPLMGRSLLPHYGGGAAVWGVCLAFFQTGLLLAYAGAHTLAAKFNLQVQSRVFLLGLAVALCIPLGTITVYRTVHPAVAVSLSLLCSIGLPYLVLGMTSPLLQVWFRDAYSESSPYRLYATSNLGSLLGLLCYPFLFEPFLTLGQQLLIWRWLFLVFVLMIAKLSWSLEPTVVAEPSAGSLGAGVKCSSAWSWVGLSAAAAALLVVFSTYLTEDIAPVPLLWVLPLALFLISYSICFADSRWFYERACWWLMIVATILVGMNVHGGGLILRVSEVLILLFSIFMLCNGQLYHLRPAADKLTSFYLYISLGGAVGGLAVTFIAPFLFPSRQEVPLVLALAVILLFVIELRRTALNSSVIVRAVACTVAVGFFGESYLGRNQNLLAAGRDFYGSHRVDALAGVEYGEARVLVHGSTTHGAQLLADPQKPLSYYSASSAIGQVFRLLPQLPRRIGAIGLGSGTLAAYLRPNDELDFFEISETMTKVAYSQFSFLNDSQGIVRVHLGDGRLKLSEVNPAPFDLLLLDAFNSDALPVHLYTLEAFKIYFKFLKPTGVLCAHISNRFLDMKPALFRIGDELNISAYSIVDKKAEGDFVYPSEYVLFSRDPELSQQLGSLASHAEVRRSVLWRDDFYSVFSLLGR